MATVTAKESFSTDIDGVPVTVAGGSLWEDDAEVVKRYPDKFEAPEAPDRIAASQSPDVEQATAAPGEKRSAKPKARAKAKKDD